MISDAKKEMESCPTNLTSAAPQFYICPITQDRAERFLVSESPQSLVKELEDLLNDLHPSKWNKMINLEDSKPIGRQECLSAYYNILCENPVGQKRCFQLGESERACASCHNAQKAQSTISKTLLKLKLAKPSDLTLKVAKECGDNLPCAKVYVTGLNASMVHLNNKQLVPHRPKRDRAGNFTWQDGGNAYEGDVVTLKDLMRSKSCASSSDQSDRRWNDLHYVIIQWSAPLFCNKLEASKCNIKEDIQKYNRDISLSNHHSRAIPKVEATQETNTRDLRRVVRSLQFIHSEEKKVNANRRVAAIAAHECPKNTSELHFTSQAHLKVESVIEGSKAHQNQEDNASESIESEEFVKVASVPENSKEQKDTAKAGAASTETETINTRVSTLSVEELCSLRDKYNPKSFKYNLLSIAIYRHERHNATLRATQNQRDTHRAKNGFDPKGYDSNDETDLVSTIPSLLKDALVSVSGRSDNQT